MHMQLNMVSVKVRQFYSALEYILRNMHTVFALLCFVVVIHWLIFPYPSGLLHWHCGNLTIAPVPAKQPWWIWINTSCEFIMNDCITTTKQSTTKPCAYFLEYTVYVLNNASRTDVRRSIEYSFFMLTLIPGHIFYIWLSRVCVSERRRYIHTVKPVYSDHLMGYISAFWGSSRWPRAT